MSSLIWNILLFLDKLFLNKFPNLEWLDLRNNHLIAFPSGVQLRYTHPFEEYYPFFWNILNGGILPLYWSILLLYLNILLLYWDIFFLHVGILCLYWSMLFTFLRFKQYHPFIKLYLPFFDIYFPFIELYFPLIELYFPFIEIYFPFIER